MTRKRLLVVEDEAVVAMELRHRLCGLGYDVCAETAQGEEAVRLAAELLPDLVLMDIHLQGELDGIAAAEIIQRNQNVPVVYLTAHADEGTLRRAVETAPFGYVLKPFQERELRSTIETALFKDQAEKRVRASERRWATILASIGDAVVAADDQGRVAFMNPPAERLIGWPAGEAAGRTLDEIFRLLDGNGRKPIPDPIGRMLADGDKPGPNGEKLLLTRDGREVPIRDSAAPILDEKGNPTGVVLVFRDATAALRQEQELRQLQKMEAVGQLAGGVAHDFNNLLTVINGFSDLLLTTMGADHPWAGLVQEIHKAGQRAADLTRQLLAFGRKQMLQRKVLDLNHMVAGTEKMLRRLLPENVDLVTDLLPNLPAIKADPTQVDQVLLNLAVNARDAMPEGGRLTIATVVEEWTEADCRVRLERRPGRWVGLWVKDDGQGMAPEVLAHLFEPFFTTKEFGHGTGLGLATVYGIIKQSDGLIEVDSAVGRGTTFRVYFPAADEESPPERSAAGGLNWPRGTETILLVEDEEAVRTFAQQILQMCGYQVLSATDGVEALELLNRREEHIDLLVTDVIMPNMSGLQLYRLLQGQRPDLRALFVSGHTGTAMLDFGEGKLPFLAKPYTGTALANEVRELLDGKKAEEPTPAGKKPE